MQNLKHNKILKFKKIKSMNSRKRKNEKRRSDNLFDKYKFSQEEYSMYKFYFFTEMKLWEQI